MADDIDIEEHDVLDNPRIKEILPSLDFDFTTIKTEKPDVDEYDIDHHFNGSIEDNHQNGEDTAHEEQTEAHVPVPDGSCVSDIDESLIGNNRYILGSKPCRGPNSNSEQQSKSSMDLSQSLIFGVDHHRFIKTEPVDTFDDYMELEIDMNSSPVIILGSKPNTNVEEEDQEERDVYGAIVKLEDWGPRLSRSMCYCSECEILFPTRNTLDAHKMAAHSYLVALECNRAVKSTARGQLRIGSNLNQPPSGGRYCNHCSRTFPDDNALIKHLYEILTSEKKVFKCNQCEASFKSDVELKAHAQIHEATTSSGTANTLAYYTCFVCHYYFKDMKYYKIHMEGNHKYKGQLNPRMVPVKTCCRFCTFKSVSMQSYLKHVREKHNEIFMEPASNQDIPKLDEPVKTPSKTNKPVNEDSDRYICLVCNSIFSTFYFAQKHRAVKHPDSNDSDIKQIGLKSPSSTPTKAQPSMNVVPKDVLFNCIMCGIHFLNLSEAIEHTKGCAQHKGDFRCKKCWHTFQVKDRIIHHWQHTFIETFHIYGIHEDIIDKILCKCPNCSLYLHYQDFLIHHNNCNPCDAVDCDYCNHPMHPSTMDTHERLHLEFDVDDSDFLLVDYMKTEHVPAIIPSGQKRTAADARLDADGGQEKRKRDQSMHFYYCKACSFCFRSNKIQEHYTHCGRKKNKHICKICGLYIASIRHDKFHQTFPRSNVKDYQFQSIDNMKYTPPPMPPYPKCSNCLVNFISDKALESHECRDNFKTCKYCKLKFSDLALKLHLPLHEHGKKATNAPPIQRPKLKPKVKKAGDMPELLKKYELLTNTWNILYVCKVCEIAYDCYDKSVEHSQKHYSNMESYDMVVQPCDKCELNFDGSCFEQHLKMHATNTSLDSNSLVVLTYDPTTLLTTKWFEMFGNMSKAQVEQITSRSIYSPTRCIKMRVIEQGSQELTVYKCARCDKYVHPTSMVYHYRFESCTPDGQRFYCGVCRITYSSYCGRMSHEFLHKKNPKAQFRVVLINEDGDEEFNSALKTDNERKADADAKTTSSKLHYYKCRRCSACIRHKLTMHDCKAKTAKCRICGLLFNRGMMPVHMAAHKKTTRVCVTLVDPPDMSTKKQLLGGKNVAKVYKCSCGLHFTTPTSLEEHGGLCSGNLEGSNENCSKCGLLFPTSVLVSHLCRHHKSDETRIEVVTPQGATPPDASKRIRKCGKCNLYFMNQKSLRKHCVEDSHRVTKVSVCPKCGLRFSHWKALRNHIEFHHNIHKLRLEDLHVKGQLKVDGNRKDTASIPEQNDENAKLKSVPGHLKSIDMSMYDNRLYKCTICGAHFLNYSTHATHLLVTHQKQGMTKVHTEKCPTCGLSFVMKSLQRHLYIHHMKMKLKRKDFRIKVRAEQGTVTKLTPLKLLKTSKPLKPMKQSKKLIQPNPGRRTLPLSRSVYHCSECGLYFLTCKTLHTHKVKTGCLNQLHGGIACSECGLTFKPTSLRRHILEHHQIMKLTRKDIKIVTGRKAKTEIDSDAITETSQSGTEVTEGTSQSDTEVAEASQEEEESQDKGYDKSDLVNLRIVYRCAVCSVNFVTYSSLNHHVQKSRFQHNPGVECDVCHWMFGGDLTLSKHKELHHNAQNLEPKDIQVLSSDAITWVGVGGFSEDRFTENLYKCNKCEIMSISVYAFSRHIVNCPDKDISRVKCDICDLYFTQRLLPYHVRIHHDKLKFERSDFKIFNDLDIKIEEPKNVKRSVNLNSAFLNNLFFKCGHCSVHCLKQTDIERHHLNACEDEKKLCPDCDQYFDAETFDEHLEKHNEIPSLTIQDFDVVTTISVDGIVHSNLIYKCCVCRMFFLTQDEVVKHSCVPEQVKHKLSCRKCDLTFTSVMIRRHKYIHHEKMDLTKKDFHVILYNNRTKKCVDAFRSKMQCEPYKDVHFSEEYLSLLDDAAYDKSLYKCCNCPLHFVTRAASTDHVCDASRLRVQCVSCNLEFDRYNLVRHEYIQHFRLGLKSEEFRVETLGQLEDPLSIGDGDSTITSDSSRLESSFSSKVNTANVSATRRRFTKPFDIDVTQLDASSYDNIIYKCNVCLLHFLKLKTVERHQHRDSGLNCPTCGLEFSPKSLARHQYVHHTVADMTLEDFEIKPFDRKQEGFKPRKKEVAVKVATDTEEGGPATEDSRESSICRGSIANEDSTDSSSIHRGGSATEECTEKEPKSDLLSKEVTVYKCRVCPLHYITRDQLIKHHTICKRQFVVHECTMCGLEFSATSLKRHMLLHHHKRLLTREGIKVVQLDDVPVFLKRTTRNSDAGKAVKNLPIDTSMEITLNASESTGDDSVSLSESQGDDISLNESVSAASVENVEKVTLYKCGVCGIHLELETALDKHIANHSHKVRLSKCRQCGLAFSTSGVSVHERKHHIVRNMTVDNFDIVTKTDDEIAPVNAAVPLDSTVDCDDSTVSSVDTTVDDAESKQKHTLFKCGVCNVYFLSRIACNKHVSKHTKLDPKEYIECKLCDLQFKILSLQKHIVTHHSTEFNLDDVLIEEHRPQVAEGASTAAVDIYPANDKIQSKLISTTSELADTDVKIKEEDTGVDDVETKSLTTLG